MIGDNLHGRIMALTLYPGYKIVRAFLILWVLFVSSPTKKKIQKTWVPGHKEGHFAFYESGEIG